MRTEVEIEVANALEEAAAEARKVVELQERGIATGGVPGESTSKAVKRQMPFELARALERRFELRPRQ